MQNFKTLVKKLHVPSGTPVTHDDTKDTTGKTGKLLCAIPQGGSLFYAKSELEETTKI